MKVHWQWPMCPNPSADGMFNITMPSNQPTPVSIIVTDVLGRKVFYDPQFSQSYFTIPYLKGIYTLKLTSGNDTYVNSLIIN